MEIEDLQIDKQSEKCSSKQAIILVQCEAELEPCAALKGVPPPNGPRGDEGVN